MRVRLGLVAGLVALTACAAPATPDSTADRRTVGPPKAGASPTAIPSIASEGAGPAASPVDGSQAPRTATTDLSWTLSGSFGETNGSTSVQQMLAFDGGVLAVGVESANPVMPQHDEGRVWVSADGREWADVTPRGLFADISLTGLIVTNHDTLVTFGTRSGEDEGGAYYPSEAVAWESQDGRRWEPTATGLPELVRAPRIVSGALGYLALIGEADYAPRGECPKMYCFFELWFSSDGRHWEQVSSLEKDARAVAAAGDEGFVVAGVSGPAGQAYVFASGDGRRWFEAATPPPAITGLAAIGGDWLVLTGDSPTRGAQPSTVWRSANGLDWAEIGDLSLGSIPIGDGECRELARSLFSVRPWLVASTGLDFPCVDVHRHASLPGRPRLSLDGISWVTLPPSDDGAGSQSDRGFAVSAAVATGDRLVLAGSSDEKATFWLGEP